MSALSNYIEPKIRSLIFGGTQWAGKPTTFYLGLFTTAGSDTGPGTEYTGNGYARKSIACNSANWTVSGASVENLLAIKFANAATADWEGITHWGLFDKATGGNLLFYGQFKETRTVPKYSTANIPVGELGIDCNQAFGTWMANKILKYLFQAQTWASVATIYVGYGTNADADQLYGEPIAVGGATATGYARGSLVNTTSKWPASTSSPDTTSNGSSITNFPDATADLGQFSYQALLDAALVTSGITYDQTTTAVTGATYSQTGTTITVTKTSHGLVGGEAINITFSTGTATSGYYVITSVDVPAHTFTITSATSTSTTGNASYVPMYITVTKTAHGLATTNAQTGAAQHVDLWFTSASGGTYPTSKRYYVASVPSSSTFRVNLASDETQLTNSSSTATYSTANLIGFSALTSAITVNNTDTTTVPTGAITAQLD